VSDYLALQTARFEERLSVRVEVEPDARRCWVPSMLIQTLVENAVIHGISHIPAGGVVSIRGIRQAESLMIEVVNSGSLVESESNGLRTGLTNARERLRLLYGKRASLELSGSNGTVTAKVVIPQTS